MAPAAGTFNTADHAALDKLAKDLSVPEGGKYILVAKRFPPDLMGEDLKYTHPERKSVPVSLLSERDHGPRRTRHGQIVGHTLLGDADDFEQMDRMFSGDPDDGSYYSDEGSESDESFGEQQQQQAPPAHRRKSAYDRAAAEEAKRKQEEERNMWLSQLHIFQRYREVREERALKNWQRHSVEWNRTETLLANKSKRTPSDLLMARIGEYRQRLEEHELVETALRLLDEEHVDFWKVGLRLGSDLLGLTMPIPRGGPRQIERVRTYERSVGLLDTGYSLVVGPDGLDRAGKNDAGKRRPLNAKEQMYGDIISLFDPFHQHGDSGYLELEGHNTVMPSRMHNLATSYLAKLDSQKSSSGSMADPSGSRSHTPRSSSAVPGDKADDNEEPASHISGPALTLATNRLSFTNVLKQVSVSVLTVYNCGTTACQFEWVKVVRPNPLNVSAIYEPTQRFFFYYKKGVIHPDSAFDFPIIFKSTTPGIYTEEWTLKTTPALSEPQPMLVLQGIAIEEDVNSAKRKALEVSLTRAQALTAAKSIVSQIISSIKPRTTSARSLRRLAANRDEQLFARRNRELGLYYTSKHFTRLLKVVSETHAVLGKESLPEWDRSVASLAQLISTVEDRDVQSTLLRRLNGLIVAMGVAPTDTADSMLHVIAHDTLTSLAETISEVSDGLRRRFTLPIMRSATRFDDTGDAWGGGENSEAGHTAPPPQQQQAQQPAPQAAQLPPAVQQESTRKATPPVAAAAAEEKPGKKTAPSAAKDAGKKGAAAATQAASGGAAGGKGGKAGATPTAQPAQAPAAVPAVAAGKAGKVDADVEQQPVRAPLVLSKITAKIKKPDSSRGWNKERKASEEAYRVALRSEVTQVIDAAISRMCQLFDDAGSNF